jgi:multidrug efflux pump subunit AcrA (membrane-fusion protein)
MKRVIAWTIVAALTAACHREAAPVAESSNGAAARTEVVLSPAAQQEGQIETQAAKTTSEPEMLRVSGHIALADNRTWRVGIRTDGLVVAVFVGAGDYVRQGQVLARYHADEVRDSRARYHAAQAELARAESASMLAQRNLERAGTLLELKAASQQQVDQARQDAVAAQSAVRSAQTEVDRLKDLLEDDLRVPAEPKPGDETADQVPIIAPASGYILEKNITLGKAIDTMDDTFVIGDLSQVWMLASVRQEQLGALRIGQPVRVTVAGTSGTGGRTLSGSPTFEGRIANLGQSLDPQTRTMQVRIALSNSGNQLRPEMLATAEIPAGPPHETVLVPSDALQQIDGQDVVFVRTAPDRFSVRPVQVAETRNGETPIVQGLKGGEQVVVKGSFVLKSQLLKATLEEGE